MPLLQILQAKILRSSNLYFCSSMYSLLQSISSHLLVSLVSLSEISSFAINRHDCDHIYFRRYRHKYRLRFERSDSKSRICVFARNSLFNCKTSTDNSIDKLLSLSSFTVVLQFRLRLAATSFICVRCRFFTMFACGKTMLPASLANTVVSCGHK